MSDDTKKTLGQHWLKDKTTLENICSSANVVKGDVVLEVGPGLGTLTEILLETGAKVTSVEFDEDLLPGLTKKFKDNKKFKLVRNNIINFDLREMPKNYKIVANIPYYLTSNLIRKINESEPKFSIAALLVQKEVAERVCASPGEMSILSVAAQFYCNTSLGIEVPKEQFTPPPKVDSRVLILESRNEPIFPDVNTTKFFRLVKAGFSEKRKMLRSSLAGGLDISKQEVEKFLKQAKIEPTKRAQELSLEEWHNLYKVVA